jgi:hypothetical protein
MAETTLLRRALGPQSAIDIGSIRIDVELVPSRSPASPCC